MAGARHDPYSDNRQATPRRQLLTVSELEQLFGPDATVELRSTRPERVEADLEVVPPRRTSPWMAPVLLVVFAAASLVGYALLRDTKAVSTVTGMGSWLGNRTLGPTEETPIEVDYELPPLVAKISSSPETSRAPAPPEGQPPAAAAPPVVLPSSEAPPSPPEPPPVVAKPKRATPPSAAKAPRAKPARRAAPDEVPYPAVGHEADDRATRDLIEREVDRLGDDATPVPRGNDNAATYPPGYIEAEIK